MFLQTFNTERCIDAKSYFLQNNLSKNKIVHVVVSKLYCNVSFVWIGPDLRKEERKMGLACGTVHPRGQTKSSLPLAPPPPPPFPAGQLVPSPDDASLRCCRFLSHGQTPGEVSLQTEETISGTVMLWEWYCPLASFIDERETADHPCLLFVIALSVTVRPARW